MLLERPHELRRVPHPADERRLGHVDEDVEVVRQEGVRKDDDSAPRLVAPPGCCAGGYELLDSAHQRHRAVLLLVVEEECPVRKPADQVVAPVLPYEPVFPHAGIIPKTLGLYQQCCINMTLLTRSRHGQSPHGSSRNVR